MASLVFLAGPNSGRRYKLGDGDYVIGRRSDCQIFVPDMRVSRQHARIRRADGAWCIEDLGSNNGTYVNGFRVQSVPIHHDDEIGIANNRIRVELPGQTRPESEFDSRVTIVNLENAAVYMSQDIDSSQLLRSSLAGIQDAQRETRLLERKLEAIGDILEIAANTAEPDELLAAVVSQLLVVFPQASSVGLLVEDERSGELRVKSHEQRRGADDVRRSSGGLEVPSTIVDHVIHDRRGVLLRDTGGTSGPDEPSGQRMGAPIRARDQHYGVIYVECDEGSFRREDLDLLTSIAAQAGLALHAAKMHRELQTRQRLERDLRVARQIQRSLLPAEPPNVLGLDFAVHYEPAYQIGGDFYDFIWHDKTHLALVVGDVAGKAISAALYMARLTSELRSRAAIARTPARLLRRVNAEMVKLGDDGMFATLFYAIYDLESRSLAFTNAGHVVPLLRRGDKVYPLHADEAHTPPLGVMPEVEFGEARVQLHSGDVLLFTSDGVHEARDPRGNQYGAERLAERMKAADGGVDELVKSLLDDLDAHTADAWPSDDITMVAMSVNSRRARRRTTTIPGLTDRFDEEGTK